MGVKSKERVKIEEQKASNYKMLSLKRCREILKDPTLSDEEVEKLRDCLYAITENILTEYFNETKSRNLL